MAATALPGRERADRRALGGRDPDARPVSDADVDAASSGGATGAPRASRSSRSLSADAYASPAASRRADSLADSAPAVPGGAGVRSRALVGGRNAEVEASGVSSASARCVTLRALFALLTLSMSMAPALRSVHS